MKNVHFDEKHFNENNMTPILEKLDDNTIITITLYDKTPATYRIIQNYDKSYSMLPMTEPASSAFLVFRYVELSTIKDLLDAYCENGYIKGIEIERMETPILERE